MMSSAIKLFFLAMALACVAARPEFEFPEADEKDKKIPINAVCFS